MQKIFFRPSISQNLLSDPTVQNITYDYLEHESVSRRINLILLILPNVFLVIGLAVIAGELVDNPAGPASSFLAISRNISLDFAKWFSSGFWHSPITPSPFYCTVSALIIKFVGYDSRWVMMATCILGALSGYALGLISYRRFGLVAALTTELLVLLSPVVIANSLSAGYYFWAVPCYLFAIVLLDQYILSGKQHNYILSALLSLLAGMSRPEFFAFVLPVVVLVPARLYARIGYMLIA